VNQAIASEERHFWWSELKNQLKIFDELKRFSTFWRKAVPTGNTKCNDIITLELHVSSVPFQEKLHWPNYGQMMHDVTWQSIPHIFLLSHLKKSSSTLTQHECANTNTSYFGRKQVFGNALIS
jgi:hypothetical protein